MYTHSALRKKNVLLSFLLLQYDMGVVVRCTAVHNGYRTQHLHDVCIYWDVPAGIHLCPVVCGLRACLSSLQDEASARTPTGCAGCRSVETKITKHTAVSAQGRFFTLGRKLNTTASYCCVFGAIGLRVPCVFSGKC